MSPAPHVDRGVCGRVGELLPVRAPGRDLGFWQVRGLPRPSRVAELPGSGVASHSPTAYGSGRLRPGVDCGQGMHGGLPIRGVHGKEGFSVGSALFFVWVIMFRAARQGAGVPDETTAGEGIGETGYGR